MCGACARAARGARERGSLASKLPVAQLSLVRAAPRAHPRRLSLHERVAHVPRGGERAAASHTRSTRYAAHALRRAQMRRSCLSGARGRVRAHNARGVARTTAPSLAHCFNVALVVGSSARVSLHATPASRARACCDNGTSTHPRGAVLVAIIAPTTYRRAVCYGSSRAPHFPRGRGPHTRAPCAVRVSRAPVFASYERGHARPLVRLPCRRTAVVVSCCERATPRRLQPQWQPLGTLRARVRASARSTLRENHQEDDDARGSACGTW